MRARNLKPGFFRNDLLGECDPLARILFSGLWCEADREGRLEDRPKRLKAECLPYDTCDVDALLDQLVTRGFINRYVVDGKAYIAIPEFAKHQNPHVREPASQIPAPGEHSASTVQAPDENRTGPALSPSLIPESPSLTPVASASPPKTATKRAPKHHGDEGPPGFVAFYAEYPKKVDRKIALKVWNRGWFEEHAEQLLADVRRRKTAHRPWVEGFAPNPATYLNGERWNDEMESPRTAGPQFRSAGNDGPSPASRRPLL